LRLKRNGQSKSEGDEAEIDNEKVKGCKAADDLDQIKLLQLSQAGPKFSHSTKPPSYILLSSCGRARISPAAVANPSAFFFP
jgi:hypothetical protein